MKICSKCKRQLDKSEFSPSSGGKYLRPECRECAKRLSKERKNLRDIHGYPSEDYVCPICLKDEKELKGTGGNASVWVVDHDHNNNKFRGHLCHNCNRGIGIFNDDIDTFLRAIEYLK